jgi:hypothetical protein
LRNGGIETLSEEQEQNDQDWNWNAQ